MRSGKIGSLEIRVNQGDPMPPVSFLLSPDVLVRRMTKPWRNFAFFTAPGITEAIKIAAPSASVKIGHCQSGLGMECHKMSLYKSNE